MKFKRQFWTSLPNPFVDKAYKKELAGTLYGNFSSLHILKTRKRQILPLRERKRILIAILKRDLILRKTVLKQVTIRKLIGWTGMEKGRQSRVEPGSLQWPPCHASTTLGKNISEKKRISIQAHKKKDLNFKWFCICCKYKG